MFEKRLKEISKKLGEKENKEFYILTHKKHKREIYFQNNKEAIKFMKGKFNSLFKQVVYALVRVGLLQPFIKKIELSSKIGDVIYVANQIKSFDLDKKIVSSFTKKNAEKSEFIKSKGFQRNIAKKGFAPTILEINEKIPFSKEELLREYRGGRDIEVFRKLMKFYKSEGIKKIHLKQFIKSLKRKYKDQKINNMHLENLLDKLSEVDRKILVARLHGDFAKENILVDKKGKIFFIDWNPEEGVIAKSLINFFRGEEDLLNNKRFVRILKEVFPKEVQKNIKLYILLSEISSITKHGKPSKISMKRIEKYSD